MALFRMKMHSDVLDMTCPLNVIYPQQIARGPSFAKPPAILYLLHGLVDDQDAFLVNLPLERLVRDKNLMVVMPYSARAFYTNQARGYRYYDYIAKELPQILRQFFNFTQDRANTYIMGFSMGGFGALKLALTQPECFSKVVALAPSVMTKTLQDAFTERGTAGEFLADLANTFGEGYPSGDNDLLGLAKAFPKECPHPEIWMATGMLDYLMPGSHALDKRLRDNGFSVVYHEIPEAGHSWEFVESQIPSVFSFLGI